MGMGGLFFFGEKDTILCEEIAKEHKLDLEKVKAEYKKMLEHLKNDEKISD